MAALWHTNGLQRLIVARRCRGSQDSVRTPVPHGSGVMQTNGGEYHGVS
jgi:hypothetical protein